MVLSSPAFGNSASRASRSEGRSELPGRASKNPKRLPGAPELLPDGRGRLSQRLMSWLPDPAGHHLELDRPGPVGEAGNRLDLGGSDRSGRSCGRLRVGHQASHVAPGRALPPMPDSSVVPAKRRLRTRMRPFNPRCDVEPDHRDVQSHLHRRTARSRSLHRGLPIELTEAVPAEIVALVRAV
jgi:hypothetical protein